MLSAGRSVRGLLLLAAVSGSALVLAIVALRDQAPDAGRVSPDALSGDAGPGAGSATRDARSAGDPADPGPLPAADLPPMEAPAPRTDEAAAGNAPPGETRAETIARLIRELGDAKPEARRLAAQRLSEMVPKPGEAVPALCAALEDPDPFVRWSAVRALVSIASEVADAVQALRVALDNRVPTVQFEAARALLKQGARPDEVVPALIDAVRKERWTFRSQAIQLLGSLGPAAADAVPVILVLLDENDGETCTAAAAALAGIWGEEFPQKAATLELRSEAAVLGFVRALRERGAGATPAMRIFERALESTDKGILMETTQALLEIHGASDEILHLLTGLVEEGHVPGGTGQGTESPGGDRGETLLLRAMEALARRGHAESRPDIRFWAAWALGELGPAARPAVPALLKAAGSGVSMLSGALSALRRIDPRGDLLIPAARDFLANGDPQVRSCALDALMSFREPPPESVAAVRGALQDPDPRIRRKAAAGLARMDPAAGSEAARAWIESFAELSPEVAERSWEWGFSLFTDPLLRNPASVPSFVEALRYGPRDARSIIGGRILTGLGKQAVPALVQVLERGDAVTRREAARLLGIVGAEDSSARDALRSAMDDPDPHLRFRCAAALAATDPADRSAASRMLEALRSPDPGIRAAAAAHFCRKEARDKAAIPGLIALVEDSDPGVRKLAAGALAGFGEEAAEAVPALIRLLRDRGRRGDDAWDIAEDLPSFGARIVPPLVGFIEGEDEELRPIGFEMLRRLGERAASVIPRMEALLRSSDPVLVGEAAGTLLFLGPKGLSAAAEALADDSPGVRLSVAKAVVRDGQSEWRVLLPALAEAARKDANPGVRVAALDALSGIGGKDPIAADAVDRALQDPSREVRRAALAHFVKWGLSLARVSLLVPLLGSAEEGDRVQALSLLSLSRETPVEAIPPLLRLLNDSNTRIRAGAANALGVMGTCAAEAAQALRAACADPDESVQREARLALNRVEGKVVVR